MSSPPHMLAAAYDLASALWLTRRRAHITQAECGLDLGVSRMTIHRWEAGSPIPYASVIPIRLWIIRNGGAKEIEALDAAAASATSAAKGA